MRRFLLASAVLFGTVGALLSPAAHAATTTSFTTNEQVIAVDPPASQSQHGNLARIRGQRITALLNGDIDGVLVLVADVDVDVRTGNGTLRGTFSIQLDDGRTFTGTFAGTLRGGLGSTRFVGRGPDGSSVVGRTVESAPGVAVVTGTITAP